MIVDYDARYSEHGLFIERGLLGEGDQAAVVALARDVTAAAPLVRPTMADGTPLRVQVTSCGDVGWMADLRRGYHYAARHPLVGPWPPMSTALRGILGGILAAVYGADMAWMAGAYDTCLFNWYSPSDSLGWHQDVTEADRCMPIVGVSLGDPARFEIELTDETVSTVVRSGDVVIMGGFSRLARHRVAEVMPPDLFGPRSPLSRPGRLSLTFRRARCLPGEVEDRVRRKR